MIEKVIFIYAIPFNKKIEKEYWFNQLIENNIPVEYWDISHLSYNEQQIKEQFPEVYEKPFVIKISDLNIFRKKLHFEDNKQVLFIVLFSHSMRPIPKFVQILRRKKFAIGYYEIFPDHKPPVMDVVDKKFFQRVIEKIVSKQPITKKITSLVYYLKNLLNNQIQRIIEPSFKEFSVVFTTAQLVRNFQAMKKVKTIVKVNHFDYDYYLENSRNANRLVSDRYCVFLDQYLPYHFELKLVKRAPIDAAMYYENHNSFFHLIEKKFNLKVVVADHPRSYYEGNYPFEALHFKYKTSELVKDCEFVLSFNSAAIYSVVLYKKPLIFIYTDQQTGRTWENDIEAVNENAAKLDAIVFNINHLNEKDIVIPKVNLEKYEQYKYEFLTTPESENSLSSEIFVKFLKHARIKK